MSKKPSKLKKKTLRSKQSAMIRDIKISQPGKRKKRKTGGWVTKKKTFQLEEKQKKKTGKGIEQ